MLVETRYDRVLQELRSEFDVLMLKYLRKLYAAYHVNYGQKNFRTDIIDKMMRQDCLSIFSNNLDNMALDNQSENENIKMVDAIWGEYELPRKGNEDLLRPIRSKRT